VSGSDQVAAAAPWSFGAGCIPGKLIRGPKLCMAGAHPALHETFDGTQRRQALRALVCQVAF